MEDKVLYTCRDGEVLTVPTHLAVIPDGNRRWAKEHKMFSFLGHQRGAEVYKKLLTIAMDLKIKYITFYAFSTENWKRSSGEVQKLMELFMSNILNIKKELGQYKDSVRFCFIGDRTILSPRLRKAMEEAERVTAANTDLIAFFALNYGGRAEIVQSVKDIAQKVKDGELDPQDISEEMFSKSLYTMGAPDPDLLIRTAGENRISNFLLWQMAYTEYVFFDKYWPDMTSDDIVEAIRIYNHRQRRFGGN